MFHTLQRRAVQAAVIALSVFTAACGKKEQQFTPPPPEVGVQVVEERAAPLDLTYMARVAGVREVEVRARVSGILERRLYKEGARVKQGDLLFRIDPAPYEAEAARVRAQAGMERARAAEAAQQRKRLEPLLSQGVVSRSEYDQAVAAADSAAAALTASQAALRKAELDLGYTQVRAPIAGLTSRETRSEGSLVNAADAQSNLLTRIVQTDQLYIDFSMASAEAALVQRALAAQNGKPLKVTAIATNGTPMLDAAELTFVDTAVDPGSGTVQARATVRTPKENLVPGQFVRARIDGVTLPKSTVVPVRSVLRSAMGTMVWVVGAGDKVEPRPVQLGETTGNNVAVLDGLKSGERVIIDGVIKVQPGIVVKPVTVDDKPTAAGSSQPPQTPGQPHSPDAAVSAQPAAQSQQPGAAN